MQSRKSSFALSIMRSATVVLILLVAGVAFASGTTPYTENTIYSFGANALDGQQWTRIATALCLTRQGTSTVPRSQAAHFRPA